MKPPLRTGRGGWGPWQSRAVRSPGPQCTAQGRQQRGLAEFDIDALFRHTPLSQALRQAGIVNSTWEDPEFLGTLGERRPLGKVTRPVLHVTGWSDMVYRASLEAWEQLSARASAPQKLVVGPWYHDQMMIGEWEVGDAHFGPASGFGVDELIALSLRWFDATLKGKKNGMLREPDVTYFLKGQNAWHTASTWPLVESAVEMQRWYLDSAGGGTGRRDTHGWAGRTWPSCRRPACSRSSACRRRCARPTSGPSSWIRTT